MTDPTEPIELRHLINPEGRMSGTESFGQSPTSNSYAMESSATHTDVGAMAPLYQTVPEAGKSHAQYKAEQVRGKTPPTDKPYMTPGKPDETNEYDIINERQVRGKASSHITPPQVQLHSENALYGDQRLATEEMRHATLTMDKQHFSGGLATYVTEGTPSKGCCGGNCSWLSIWMCFFVILSLVIALTALVLVIVIAFGVYEVPCNCEDDPTPSVPLEDITDLQAQVDELSTMLETANETITALQDEVDMLSARVSETEVELGDVQVTPAKIEDVLTSGNVSFNASFTGVGPFVNCTTELLAQTVLSLPSMDPTGPSAVVGLTPSVSLEKEGFYTVSAFCARTDNTAESNPLVTTLQLNNDNRDGRCFCSIIVPDTNLPQQHAVMCGLYVNRCPSLQDYDATVQP